MKRDIRNKCQERKEGEGGLFNFIFDIVYMCNRT